MEFLHFFHFLVAIFGDPLPHLRTLRHIKRASREKATQSRSVLQPVRYVLWSNSRAGILLNRDAGPNPSFLGLKILKNTGKNKSSSSSFY